ncbi:MAG TPA: tetratricopeptide repeat protein [Blastocatellia bacterium]|nr:tetratricopeptide repeat protein [Blastocatellia bacterium]
MTPLAHRLKRWLAIISLMLGLAASAQIHQPSITSYAEPSSCASCHQAIAESYARSAMARTFGVVRSAEQFPELNGGNYFHAPSAQYFTLLAANKQPVLQRHQLSDDSKPINVFAAPINYWFGSGKHARSYISRTASNELIELPLTWYAENKGYWAMSPGYDRADHAGFSRKLTYRCMSCHNGVMSLPNPTWETGTRFPAQLPTGIDCQRCHGPGQAHVEAAQQGFDSTRMRSAIVNPARLTPARQMEVCMQCHLETTTLKLPASLLRAGREVFSYRPGEPLENYILHFDRAGKPSERFEFASAAYQLRKSACFKQSGGKMTCTTCHNPHEPSDTPAAQQRYITVCQSCHQTTLPKLIAARQHTTEQNCAACHLPKRHPADAIHTSVTDHFIQKRPAPEPTGQRIEQHDGNTSPYRGNVEFYYPTKLAQPAEQELYEALAQVKHDTNLTAGLPALSAAIARHAPVQAEFYFELAEAYRRAGNMTQAVTWYEQASTRAAADWRIFLRFGTALTPLNQPPRAAAALDRAQTLASQEPAILEAIASLLAQQGRWREAVAVLQSALALDPTAAPLHNAVGARLFQLNDVKGAEKAWREAVRLRPETATNTLNLANLLTHLGKFDEAKFFFQAALRSAPNYDEAHLAYAIALAAHGHGRVAEQEFQTVLRLAPQHFEAHLRLGQLLQARGERAQALPHLQKAATSPEPRIRTLAQSLLQQK